MIDLVHTVGTHLPRWASRYFPEILWRIPTSSRVAYFTFDDGPTQRVTASLLDTLEHFGTPATFFLVGHHARQDPHLVRAIVEGGHTIGNHTFTHPDAWRVSNTLLLSELERTTGVIEDQIQQRVRWMRPPYGRFTQAMLRWCQVRRQRCTMWDVGPGDYLPSATQALIEGRILDSIRPGSIIVLHDNPKTEHHTPAALATVLARLRDDGWRFAAL